MNSIPELAVMFIGALIFLYGISNVKIKERYQDFFSLFIGYIGVVIITIWMWVGMVAK
jgi:hypothetical protein